jgi:hypothetical protein
MGTRRPPLRSFCVSLALLCAAWSAGQADLKADSIFVADAQGRPAAAKVGEPFYVGLNFTVSGQVTSTYRYRIETPYGNFSTPLLNLGVRAPGTYWVCWGPVPSLMDRPVAIRAVLDPDRRVREADRSNNALSTDVVASPPTTSTELFDPRTVSGTLGLEATWNRTSAIPSEVTFWHPIPSDLDYQQASALSADLVQIVSERFEQPIGIRTFRPTNRNAIRSEAPVHANIASFRVNRSTLELLGRSYSPGLETWLRPETLVESHRAEIRSWAATVAMRLSPSASTFARAEALYRSVLERCSYEYRPGISASAVQMARRRKGDCGGFSSLFVALCRASGIPARAVGGFALGQNQWHVWAEFHISGAGWIPVDPSYADVRIPQGAGTPIYFGVIPEMNQRIATMAGYDREAGGRSVSMLQSPALFWTGSGVRLDRASPYCNLQSNP